MNLKFGLIVVAASMVTVACGGKSSSSKEEGSRRSAEAIKGDATQGSQNQQGKQGKGNQGGQQGSSLISCEFKSDDGVLNCGSLDTVLVPAQETLSRFDVRYEFACGDEGVVSPLGLSTDQQYRAFIFGAKNTVSLFGKGALSLKAKQQDLDALKSSGVDFSGCRLLVEVVNVQPVTDIYDASVSPDIDVVQ